MSYIVQSLLRKPRCFIVTCLLAILIVNSNANAQEGAPNKTFLWRAKSSTAVAYILGSIHVGKQDLYPLDARIEQAFLQSNNLVLEINLDSVTPASMQKLFLKYGLLPGNETLDQYLTTEEYASVEEILRKNGLNVMFINKFRPWVVAHIISGLSVSSAQYKSEFGIDLHFFKQAKNLNKNILELETAEFQLLTLSNFSDHQQRMFLLEALKSNEKDILHYIDMLFAAWSTGDISQMEHLVKTTRKDKDFTQKLEINRNYNMTAVIEKYLQSKDTYFIVVGSAHLVGEHGILNLLKQKGFSIEQL